MREILFRGKRKDNCKWVEGYLHKRDGLGTGYTEFAIQVQESSASRPWSYTAIPETVGQYTGMTDKNGKRIFEGDIIRCGGKVVGVVNYHDCCFCVRFIMKDHANRSNPAMDIIENEYPNDIEVIGNIHDNPELIAEVQDEI